MMRSISYCFGVGCLLTLTAPARAFSIDYVALPEGKVVRMPESAKAPKRVARSAPVEGFVLVNRSKEMGTSLKGSEEYFELRAVAEQAHSQAPSEPPSDANTCLETQPIAALESLHGEWSGGGEPMVGMALTRSVQASDTGMYVAHLERWVESSDGVALEQTDAWIDLATRGVRVFQSSRLPLVKVAEPYPGISVYAGRTAGSVEMVVKARPSENSLTGQLPSQFGQSLILARGDAAHSVSCSFVRVGFDGDLREGEVASVVTEVVARVDPGAPQAPAVGPSPEPGQAGSDPTPTEVSMRTLGVVLSVSRLSRDPYPVATVSFGLVGPERKVAF